MSGRVFVLVPPSGGALRWRRVDSDGSTAGSGVLAGDTMLDVEDDDRVTAIVPGSGVAVHWVELPRASAAQAAAAARHMAADYVAAPLTHQHVAAAAVADDNGERAIAVVEGELMERWLADLHRHGLDPHEIVPAPLMLQQVGDRVTTLRAGDMVLARGPRLAIEVEAGLADIVLPQARTEILHRDILDIAAAGADTPPLVNLRQGVYARAGTGAVDRSSVRRVLLLAAACAAIFLATGAVLALRYHFASNAIEAQIVSIASQALPGQTDLANPLAALETRRQAAGAGGGFTAMSATLFTALHASGNIRMESLRYTADGGMQATLLTPIGISLEPLKTRLAASGFNLVEGASRGSETGQRVDIEVTRL